MMAVEADQTFAWPDVDRRRRQLLVERSERPARELGVTKALAQGPVQRVIAVVVDRVAVGTALEALRPAGGCRSPQPPSTASDSSAADDRSRVARIA